MRKWTPEELADMAAADKEIEETFCITETEVRKSEKFDEEITLSDEKKRKRQRSRTYRAKNLERERTRNREYCRQHKEEITRKKMERYRNDNQYRKRIKQQKAEWWARNRDEQLKKQRNRAVMNQKLYERDGIELRERRRKLGLTQQAFADVVGVAVGTVSSWESARLKPRLDLMCMVESEMKDRGNENGVGTINQHG